MRVEVVLVVLLTAAWAVSGRNFVEDAFRRAADHARTIQSKYRAIFQDNLRKPALGLEREYDQRLPSLTHIRTLPPMQLTPLTDLIVSESLLRFLKRFLSTRNPKQDRKIQNVS